VRNGLQTQTLMQLLCLAAAAVLRERLQEHEESQQHSATQDAGIVRKLSSGTLLKSRKDIPKMTLEEAIHNAQEDFKRVADANIHDSISLEEFHTALLQVEWAIMNGHLRLPCDVHDMQMSQGEMLPLDISHVVEPKGSMMHNDNTIPSPWSSMLEAGSSGSAAGVEAHDAAACCTTPPLEPPQELPQPHIASLLDAGPGHGKASSLPPDSPGSRRAGNPATKASKKMMFGKEGVAKAKPAKTVAKAGSEVVPNTGSAPSSHNSRCPISPTSLGRKMGNQLVSELMGLDKEIEYWARRAATADDDGTAGHVAKCRGSRCSAISGPEPCSRARVAAATSDAATSTDPDLFKIRMTI